MDLNTDVVSLEKNSGNDSDTVPLQQWLGTERLVAFDPRFVALGIGVTGALLLSQAIYWSQRIPKSRKGWFYKTREEWQLETALTRSEQETARSRLRDLGILDEEKRGIPCRLYFRVNSLRLYELLKARRQQSRKLDGRKQTARLAAITPAITESTQRIHREHSSAHSAKMLNLTSASDKARSTNVIPIDADSHNQPQELDTAIVIQALQRADIPTDVCHSLVADQELVAKFVNHCMSQNKTRLNSYRLANWLIQDWEKLQRPSTARAYQQCRGVRLNDCPLSSLHALWSQYLGQQKLTPPLHDWLRSSAAQQLAKRWAEGFNTPLSSDPDQMRYTDNSSGLLWWEGLFFAIRNNPELMCNRWVDLLRIGNTDTFARILAQLQIDVGAES